MTSRSICAIVLAAGQGSRYRAIAGQDCNKLLVPCLGRDGVERPVLEHTLHTLRNTVDTCLLITRPDYLQVIQMADRYRCMTLLLDSPGMGDSIATAVAAEREHDAWLLVLGDMPFVLPATLNTIIDSLQSDAISVPVYQGQSGHPVGFGRQFGSGLSRLSGERGAKRLFQDARVQQIPVEDCGVLWDVDVPERLLFSAR